MTHDGKTASKLGLFGLLFALLIKLPFGLISGVLKLALALLKPALLVFGITKIVEVMRERKGAVAQ